MSDGQKGISATPIPWARAAPSTSGGAPAPSRPTAGLRLGLCAAGVLAAATSWGAPPGAKRAPETPEVILPPPPRVTLSISTHDRGPWAVEVLNEDERTVRLVADTRLLRLEVRPLDGEPFWCVLPDSMRSTERVLELRPGSRWVEPFDARLFCLDRVLAKGDTVVPHLGWSVPVAKPTRKPAKSSRHEAPAEKPPFVAVSADGRGVKDLEAPAVTLHASVELRADEPSDRLQPQGASKLKSLGPSTAPSATPSTRGPTSLAAPSTASSTASSTAPSVTSSAVSVTPSSLGTAASTTPKAAATKSPPPPPKLRLEAGPAQSVADARAATLSVTLRNESANTLDVYARPQLLSATVVGPGTRFECRGESLTPAPVVDFVTHLRPAEAYHGSALLAQLCPPHAFDRPGLYFVTPSLRAPKIPFRPEAASGTFTTERAQLVRIEVGQEPFHAHPAEASKAP